MSKLGIMNDIAKFFSGKKSGPKALLLAYARFGKDAVNKFFKERVPSYNFTNRNIKRDEMSKAIQKDLLEKKKGGMVKKSSKSSTKRRAGAAKRGFNNFKQLGYANKLVDLRKQLKNIYSTMPSSSFKSKGGVIKKKKKNKSVAKVRGTKFKGIF